MRRLEDWITWLLDQDWCWWPLVYLRPARDQDIKNGVLMRMTGLFGPLTGLLVVLEGYLVFLRRHQSFTFREYALCFLAGVLLFFLGCKVVVGYFWNRRARRLRSAPPPEPRKVPFSEPW